MTPLRIFISSVQKELELERTAVASLITTDPFLNQHCVPVLFENEPPAARPAKQGYLATLRGCTLYVLIIANEYGPPDGDLSATHHEYREAQRLKLPTIVFIKDAKEGTRSEEMKALIAEAKEAGYKYVRFHDREDLKPKMRDALGRALAEEFSLKATPGEKTESDNLIEAASAFEATVVSEPVADLLDQDLLNGFNQRIATNDVERVWRSPLEALQSRGLAVRDPRHGTYAPTAGAWLLFARQPADRFPQCEILADAYDDSRQLRPPQGAGGRAFDRPGFRGGPPDQAPATDDGGTRPRGGAHEQKSATTVQDFSSRGLRRFQAPDQRRPHREIGGRSGDALRPLLRAEIIRESLGKIVKSLAPLPASASLVLWPIFR